MIVLKVQELIHRFEVGGGVRAIRWVFLAAAFLAVAVLYDTLCFRNLATEEAMDAAQLARNLAHGEGFTTKLVRPFSVGLVSRHRGDRSARLKEGHPDLANPPLYPLLLAPILKVVPVEDMTELKSFAIARHDLIIAVVNQLLLMFSLVIVYRLAKRWFDGTTAVVSAVLFAACEIYWRFSISGLSTNLLIFLVLVLTWALARMEEAVRLSASPRRIALFAALAGISAGLLMLTRYSFGFIIAPALVFAGLFAAPRRLVALTVISLSFVVVIAPWIVRNILLSGTPFGTAGFAIVELTRLYPEGQLARALHPGLSTIPVAEYVRKLIINGRDIIGSDLPRMGGSWIWAFFMAGLVVPFRSVPLLRGRWFAIFALLSLIPVQALARTHGASEADDLTTDNLLVVLSPLVLVFGVGAFFVLLDSFEFPNPPLRYGAIAAFAVALSLPLTFALLPPHPFSIVFPPYYPPFFQSLSHLFGPGTLIMTDVPGAVAWYGDRQAVLLTSTWREDFTEIDSFQKPINGLYLTSRTIDTRDFGEWIRGNSNTWASFVAELRTHQEVPAKFPLRRGTDYFSQGQVLLMDYNRWRPQTK